MPLADIFRQPFPYDPCARNKLGMAAFFGGFIFAFLMVFKPFELDQFPSRQLTTIALVYGLITFTCVFSATIIFPMLMPAQFNERSWTAGKQIVFTATIIFLVGLVNYLVSPLLVDTTLELSSAIWFQGITLAVALLPVSIFILLRQNMLLKKFSTQAEMIDKKLHEQNKTPHVNEEFQQPVSKLVLTGEYQNEILELYPDDLHLVTSASNYIKLFHIQKDKLVYSIIRSSLKKAEEVLLQNPLFFKCHRAFIINLDKVVHVEGNAQGYKLKVEGHDELIPVSRNLNAEFSDRVLAFRKGA